MRIAIILSVFLLTAGCGYHAPGATDSWVGGETRTLYLQLFANETAEPYLENYLTGDLVSEFSRSRLVTLTEKMELAETRLTGKIESFSSVASSYGGKDQITSYRATMLVSVKLLAQDGRSILWKDRLQQSEEYLATADKNLQLDGQRQAARLVSQRLAEDIYSRLQNSF